MVQPYADPQEILTHLLLPLLLLIPLLYFIFSQFKSHNNLGPLPPGPTPWPIIGTPYLLKPIMNDHVALANLARVHGPLMHLRLGRQIAIVGSSPSAAAEILKINDRILSARAIPHAVPLEGDRVSVWADALSDQWKYIRTVYRTELFSVRALEAQSGAVEEKVVQMVRWLSSKERMEVNVQQIVYGTVVNMFSNAFLSEDIVRLEEGSVCDQVRGFLRGIIEAISTPNLSDFYPSIGKLDPHGLRRKHKEMSMGMWGLWEKLLRDRRRSDKGERQGQDFLDVLISKGFTDGQINKILEELFTAGIDTTASTITRTIKELVSSPESLTRLVDELDTKFNQEHSFEIFHSEKLPFLQACVKETLRLHPPAPTLLSHSARETCQLMNYTIPKNARVLVNVWAIGRDPAVWDKADDYRPERFLDSALDYKGNDFEFLPFGSGRRICPGLPMAVKLVPLVVAVLIYSFDWSSPHGVRDEIFRTTSRMMQPLVLIPRVRNQYSTLI